MFKGDLRKEKVCIIGCGRSGTKYISKVMTKLGLTVPHEVARSDDMRLIDGLSSWYATVTLVNLAKAKAPLNRYSWKDLKKEDEILTQKIVHKAREYGYKIGRV